MLNQKVNTPGNSFIQDGLGAYIYLDVKNIYIYIYIYREREIDRKIVIHLFKNDDDLNSLTLTQFLANRSIIDLTTEV